MKKKIAIHVTLIVLLAIPLFFLFWGWLNLNSKTDPEYRYETVTATEPRVYVTRTGEHYHNSSCGYLHSSQIAKGRYQAIEEGYIACSVCGGRSSGTITVTYKKRVPYDPTAKNIGGSIALAIFTSPLIYLFAYVGTESIRENRAAKKNINTQHTISASPNGNLTTTKPPKQNFPIGTSSPRPSTTDNSVIEKIARLRNTPIEKIRSFIGVRVSHKKYGTGVVVDIDQHYIQVRFIDSNEIKKFQFPEAFFDDFLSILE